MGYRIVLVWEVLYKWICFVHEWYIPLLPGDIATGDIASVWARLFFKKIKAPNNGWSGVNIETAISGILFQKWASKLIFR